MGTTASQKKLFFNLGRLKRQLQAPEQTGLSPEIVEMNDRLSGRDQSLNARSTPNPWTNGRICWSRSRRTKRKA